MYTYIPSLLDLRPTPTLIPFLQVITEHQSEVPFAGSHQLSILHSVAYIYQFQSLSSSSLYPPPHSYTNTLHLCLYSCPENRFIGTIFLDSLHIKSSIYVKVLAVQMNIHLENEKILNIFRMYCSCIKKKKKRKNFRENKLKQSLSSQQQQ